MNVLKEWTSADGKRRVQLLARENGLFSFCEDVEAVEDMSHVPLEDIVYWRPEYDSGYYETMAEAERDARRAIPWLRAPDAPD